jgi:hypothetical protein
MLSELLSFKGQTSNLPKLGAGPWSQPLCHGLVDLPVAAEEELERAQVLQGGEGRPQHHTGFGGQLLRPSTQKGKTPTSDTATFHTRGEMPTSASPNFRTGARRVHPIVTRRVGPEAARLLSPLQVDVQGGERPGHGLEGGGEEVADFPDHTTTVPISDLLQPSVSAPRTDIEHICYKLTRWHAHLRRALLRR